MIHPAYRLPAEWEEQSGVMLVWPHHETDWAPQLPEVEAVYLEIATLVASRELLLVVCRDREHRKQVKRRLVEHLVPPHRTLLTTAPYDDTWIRDNGVLTVTDNGVALLKDFRFNAWGGKYSFDQDDNLNRRLHQAGFFGTVKMDSVDVVLEGGAVETDGCGTLLATRRSIADPLRNPDMSLQDIERALGQHLGLKRFLWLDNGGLSGDDTDGHIDMLARFCDPKTILYTTAKKHDPDHPGLEMMVEELSSKRTHEGGTYRLVALPPIEPIFDGGGQRLPGSYANFLIINGAVLLPVYGDASDGEALKCLQSCFPGHEIFPVNCMPLIRQHGSLHCISRPFPRGMRFSSTGPWR